MSISSQTREKKDLEIITDIGKHVTSTLSRIELILEEQAQRINESYCETVLMLRNLLGKSSATTVATIQTMRDATHDFGEISDSVGKTKQRGDY